MSDPDFTDPPTPPRWRDRANYTSEEDLEFQRTGSRAETAEYRQARADALRDAGLEDDRPAASARSRR